MITDNFKALILSIIFVLLLLSVCVSVDYAANDTITAEQEEQNTTNCTLLGGVHYDNKIVENKTVGVAKLHKVIVEKPKLPIVSMWARPSVRCSLPYKWFHRSFIDYCPHCKRYGVLYNAHKWQARHEQEWTCRRCGADYDAVIGKEKYSWSHYYLTKA